MKILFAGDIYLKEKDNIDQINVDSLKGYISEADYFIADLESPIGNPNAYQPIFKTGPNMMAPEKEIQFLKNIGIDAVTLANNHIGDYGELAVEDTLRRLEVCGISYIGAGNNLEDAYRAIRFKKNDIRVSIIASCENEFGMASKYSAGAAGYREGYLYERIKEEKKESDYVVVFFHGGNEHNPFPSPYTKERYHQMIEHGASAVIATHTHCPQGYEFYEDGFIAYSMGNFLYPCEKSSYDLWNMGYLCQLEFEDGVKVKVIPYRYSSKKNTLRILNDKTEYINYLRSISSPIKNEEELYALHLYWAMHRGGPSYASLIDTYNERRFLEIENILRCESHREMMITYYKNVLDYAYSNASYEDFVDSNLLVMPITDIDLAEELTGYELEFYKVLITHNHICLFGCSVKNAHAISFTNRMAIDCEIELIDNDESKQGKNWKTLKVKDVESVVNRLGDSCLYVLFAGNYLEEKRCQLIKLGINPTQIVIMDF